MGSTSSREAPREATKAVNFKSAAAVKIVDLVITTGKKLPVVGGLVEALSEAGLDFEEFATPP